MVRGALMLMAALALGACGGGPPIATSIPRGAAAYENFASRKAVDSVGDYRLGPLDTVTIAVFDEPELSPKEPVSVDAAGNISLPLVGSLHAAGKTAAELSRDVADRLGAKYLRNPQVSISVVSSVSQKVSVQGEVTEPGVYAIKGPTTLLETIAMAKGESKVAKLSEVIIFRTIKAKRYGALFDVSSIRHGLAEDPQVEGGDLIIVGASHGKSLWRDIVSATPLLGAFRPLGL